MMTEHEIRKLLGGYATDALSAEERQRLFEAALEDQNLFDRLQDEDALRELLQDPVVRAQARQALEIAGRRRPSFAWRRWTVGVAVPAVVAIAVIALWKRPNAPVPPQPVAEVKTLVARAPQQAVAPTPAPKPAVKQREGGAVVARLEPPPAPAAEKAESDRAPAQFAAPRSAMFRAAVPSPAPPAIPDDVRRQFSPQLARDGPLYDGPLVQFTVERRNGEVVGVGVTVGITGYLALYQLDATGNAKHVYPEDDVATPVLTGSTIQLPSTAIKIAESGEKLRLLLVPAPASFSNGAVGGVASAPAPLVVDLPLAPTK